LIRIAFAAILTAAALLAQTAPKTADNCAPPPGSVPPTLPAQLLPGMGGVEFKITTANREAQAFFNQGVSQMHSFWVREAERSFLQAAKLDPAAPMPYWGIAMVAAGDYRPGFQLDLVNGLNPKASARTSKPTGAEARAIDAAKRAQELAAAPGAATEIEKLYIASVAARRDVSEKDPNQGYVAGLRAVIARNPGEVEARTYLALHLMSGFELPAKTPRAGTTEAVALLRQLLKDAPQHAGVHHYVIHGFEGSSFAKDAWPSCERYAALAANIPHGLHMPGHIYAQTGRWFDAAKAFSAAAANEYYWMDQDSLAGNGHHGHNVHFLATSYSFHGDYELALSAARSLLQYKETPRELAQADNYRTAWRQGWFAILRTLVQHEKWDLILDGSSLPKYDKPRERAWRHWASAVAYAAKKDKDSTAREIHLMDEALKDFKEKVKQDPPEPLLVARTELDAHLALVGGNLNKALEKFEQASAKERALRYNEPPLYPRPAAEALGKLALLNGRAALAEKAFRLALEQYPNSSVSEAGLAQLRNGSKAAPSSGGADGALCALNVHAQNGAAVRSGNSHVSGQFGGADGALCASAF